MKKDAYYFPHFCNARHDRKLKRVQKELGIEGYGIYFMLLEVLREQDGFKYPMDDIDLLADEFGTSEQKVRTVVSNYKLFVTDKSENFFSVKLKEFLKPYLKMKEQRRIAGIKSGEARRVKTQKSLETNGCSTVVQRELNENEQRKVKESKVNILPDSTESGEQEFYQTKKKRKLTGKRLETFSLFWEAFNYRKGKADAADSWLDIPQLTEKLVFEICEAAKKESINREKVLISGGTPKWAQGWLTSRRWEDEDLIAQQKGKIYVI